MLPGLMPVHTRRSFHSARKPESTGSRLPIEKHIDSPDDFVLSPETGLWLLPGHFAETDAQKDITRADHLATELGRQGSAEAHRLKYLQIVRLLGRSSIDELGCRCYHLLPTCPRIRWPPTSGSRHVRTEQRWS